MIKFTLTLFLSDTYYINYDAITNSNITYFKLYVSKMEYGIRMTKG